ncbi:hypothetical protein PPACK8108_LOCUS17556 [Phakopsora pachyrhizi]|uniref:Uncharacterized protein n=1 Tax=Phakopsora pachyrhizi TaxID=170000 RepID=A0AAV0BBT7_PHAPC|nr:hypothetical protein PPACK8108_LOCUS17556 [Phakopsora pachyrhizi]
MDYNTIRNYRRITDYSKLNGLNDKQSSDENGSDDEICQDSEPERLLNTQNSFSVKRNDQKSSIIGKSLGQVSRQSLSKSEDSIRVNTNNTLGRINSSKFEEDERIERPKTFGNNHSPRIDEDGQISESKDSGEGDDEEGEEKSYQKSVLSRFRHIHRHSPNSTKQPRKSSFSHLHPNPGTDPSIACDVSMTSNSNSKPLSRKFSSSSSLCSSSSSSTNPQSSEISYSTLTLLKSCPSCFKEWTTYKAPKSKLLHIKRCSEANSLDQTDLINRTTLTLLDRHLSKRGLEVSNVDFQSSIDLERQRTLMERENFFRNNNVKNNKPALAVSDSDSNSSSSVVTKNLRTYSHWELASGDDSFNYNRGMPRFEDWTKDQLKNESERLGFEDGSEHSMSSLIERARFGWKDYEINESDCSSDQAKHQRGLQDNYDMRFGNYEIDNDGFEDVLVESSSKAEEEVESKLDEEATEDDEEEGKTDVQPPEFEKLSKAQLEKEYGRLYEQYTINKQRCNEVEGSSDNDQEITDPSNLPKTKAAILKRIIKIWFKLNHPELLPNLLTRVTKNKKGMSNEKTKESRKRKLKIKHERKKIEIEELDRFMNEIIQAEPELIELEREEILGDDQDRRSESLNLDLENDGYEMNKLKLVRNEMVRFSRN